MMQRVFDMTLFLPQRWHDTRRMRLSSVLRHRRGGPARLRYRIRRHTCAKLGAGAELSHARAEKSPALAMKFSGESA